MDISLLLLYTKGNILLGMSHEKQVIVNILENVSESEIKNLLDGLNKIKDFKFRIKTFIEVNHL